MSVRNMISNFFQPKVEGFESLKELALDMRWSWNHCADDLWQRLDKKLWERTHNPWIVLQNTSQENLINALSDSSFRQKLDELLRAKNIRAKEKGWFQKKFPQSPLEHIAYFSMEFMLSEALPIYSGGLGNVAGDQLKAASDLGVPVIGIGLLYQQGYFRQAIDKDGAQEALFPYNDPMQLPIMPVRQPNGDWLKLEVNLPGHPLCLRAWEVQVGRNKLYLLDTNDAANLPTHRGITSELYGGGKDLRLKQELVLGLGGWRLLSALNIHPKVCHLNEGHAAFAILERARCFMEATGHSFSVALAATRAGNLFTTHTAVAAGFDIFPPELIEQYLNSYAEKRLGIPVNDLLALGRSNPADPSEGFNMAYLAVRGSGAINGVSRLHQKVSKNVFSPLFPRWPEEEIPIGYVTNGIHTPSWDSELADNLWTGACGKDRWRGATEELDKDFRCESDEKLWKFRTESKKVLINHVRRRIATQMGLLGADEKEIETAQHLLDPKVLTLGFARRFAAYKRPNLLLHDPVRFISILRNPQRPVQLLIAGKAHPADHIGQGLIQEWTRFIRENKLEDHVVFLSDYDMALTEQMVRGVDVWINTPRRPWEACGTSGMKVLVNGGINLSELDGWWAEAYCPEVGWAIGDGKEHDSDPAWDTIEANQLYDLLEKQVTPTYYTRDTNDIPKAWITIMRESMARLTPQFSANRAVREYTEKYYVPASKAYDLRAANRGEVGVKVANWEQKMKDTWSKIRMGEVKEQAKGAEFLFEAHVDLNGMDPSNFRVEIFADGSDRGPFLKEMTRANVPAQAPNEFVYTATVSAKLPAAGYTVRVVPRLEGAEVPLEANQILWQK